MCVVQAVLSLLSNELLCVNTELRVIYDAYSSKQQGMPWGWDRPQHSAALTSAQLWQLMRDCNVTEPDCSLTHINMALAQVWHNLLTPTSIAIVLHCYHCHCYYSLFTVMLLQARAPPPQLLALRREVALAGVSLAVGGCTPHLHDPTLQLLFSDFCEALVRIAHLKYRHLPTLQQRLHQLLHSHILLHAVQVSISCCCRMLCYQCEFLMRNR